VPSEYNPADDITRGLRLAELNIGHRCNDGPEFLYESAELWPENNVTLHQRKMMRVKRRKRDGPERPKKLMSFLDGRSIRP